MSRETFEMLVIRVAYCSFRQAIQYIIQKNIPENYAITTYDIVIIVFFTSSGELL